MTPLSPNAVTVLERRYLARDASGRVTETPAELMRRVATVVAQAERAYGGDPAPVEERFRGMMERLEFLPNSPALMNAGRQLGQLAACFVVPVGDSMPEIFEAVKSAAIIQMTGGGTGFAFSRLRPAGDLVASTGGAASGPLAFMDVFNSATDAIKQGGTRRGANMGVLRVDHPDILEFITAKLDPRRLRNFNVSVAVTDVFMRAVATGGTYALVNPRTGTEVRELEARRVFELMVNSAWATGDPGVIFLDRINDDHPTPSLGPIESTNPCVTGDSRIWVEGQGMIPIRELVGTFPSIATWDDRRVVFRRAAQVVRTGTRPVLRLSTVEGLDLRLTADHVVSCEHGDVPARDLEAGDRVRLLTPVPARVSFEGAEARLGELVGWVTGDGHFTDHSAGHPTVVLSFYGGDKAAAAPRLLASARTLIGDERLGLITTPSRDLQTLRSVRLRRVLEAQGVTRACKAHVPELVWRGSDDLVSGYLRGLFSADGGVQGTSTKGWSVRLASSIETLLKDVQQLLLRLGIVSVLYANRRMPSTKALPDGRGGHREYPIQAQHELVVSRAGLAAYAKTVGFLIEHKSRALEGTIHEYRRGPYAQRAFVTVGTVSEEGDEDVFDLSEPSTTHFFANGLLVHNCGEQPLLPFESCVLGSINLARFVEGESFDWPRLARTVHDAVRFLDDVIDVNHYPLPQIERITKTNRKIGLGVMGFADALIELGVPYDAPRAVEIAQRVAAFVEDESLAASAQLARERGPFASFGTSRWAQAGSPPLRNATTTTVAPTGTISIIAGCSSGIEPLFAVSYTRHVLDGETLTEIHPRFRALAEERGIWSQDLATALAERGRVRGLDAVPSELQAIFPTAHDLAPEVHVRMQAAFQRHVHAAVSKTVNFPTHATAQDIAAVYQLAYELGCKGVTVYRDRSRDEQVLRFGAEAAPQAAVVLDERCPECGGVLLGKGGCVACRSCGWSKCG